MGIIKYEVLSVRAMNPLAGLLLEVTTTTSFSQPSLLRTGYGEKLNVSEQSIVLTRRTLSTSEEEQRETNIEHEESKT